MERRTITTSALCETTDFGFSTGDRWMKVLEQEGLVLRRAGTQDSGSDIVSLTDEGWLAMDSFFEGMSSGNI